ncbi:NUDIX domain-containing protein [Thermosporothrix hazakensis]|jgi:ADP-ribose pyrophosphatase YjhB (NUDIX family)|uniref:NUDIX domain-containing protein n=2 Tax=Thermosporothrix TaxID=768650 RepID=A0A326U0S8_THEHA|nr:NUDIX hydrolase [Thermosporothrix hazakensis]PZW23408.1 NUDIX domain-containing protein [Thermosporothrix hazakensis]BBH89753.1 hypothetical protein KTC_45040 [Thermosporothrix sp. COM3]GCE47942.1 hypothetical protein KTH_28110 [Thermosporothrix hazakensis]
MFYDLLKKCVSLFFHLINLITGNRIPPFGSAAVVVEQNNRYLVVRLPGNRVVFPGGFMNWRETPQQSAEREGEEETGMKIQAEDCINVYSLVSDHWTNMSTNSFVFSGEVVGGRLHPTVEGSACWMSEQELRLVMSKHSLRILDDYLAYRKRSQQNQQTSHPTVTRVS